MTQKLSDQYLKVVEWSQEDNCYVGSAPGLIIGGIHGKDQNQVFQKLCKVVEENLALLKKEGKSIPKATANKNFSGKIALRISQELHKSLAIRALQAGESINKFIQQKLQKAI